MARKIVKFDFYYVPSGHNTNKIYFISLLLFDLAMWSW